MRRSQHVVTISALRRLAARALQDLIRPRNSPHRGAAGNRSAIRTSGRAGAFRAAELLIRGIDLLAIPEAPINITPLLASLTNSISSKVGPGRGEMQFEHFAMMPPKRALDSSAARSFRFANRDERDVFMRFPAVLARCVRHVQWNGMRVRGRCCQGAHVHVDYHEFYTLPRGRVIIGLSDIRRTSTTFGKSSQFEWSDQDGFAVVVPRGVAHVVLFEEDSVLAFGLSGIGSQNTMSSAANGCTRLGLAWPNKSVRRSPPRRSSEDIRLCSDSLKS